MNRARLEIAIMATVVNGTLAKIRRRTTPQLRAMLREAQKEHGELKMGYGLMRGIIVDAGEMFATYTGEDVPVTPEPTKVEPVGELALSRAKGDFA